MPRRTRAHPSPGGHKSLPLDSPRKIRQPRARKTAAGAAAGGEGASIMTQSSAVTASETQDFTPRQAQSPPTTTSRSQSPHPDESGSQSPQPTESRSTSPPPAQHYTRSMTRSMSRSMSPSQSMDASTPADPKRASLAPPLLVEPKRSPLAVSDKQSPLPKTASALDVSDKQSPLRKSPSTLGIPRNKSPLRKTPSTLGVPGNQSPLRKSPSTLGVPGNQSPVRRSPSVLNVSDNQSPLRKTPSSSHGVGSSVNSPGPGEQHSAKRTYPHARSPSETIEQHLGKRVRNPDQLEPKRAIKRTYSHEVFGPDVESDDDVEQPKSAKRPRTGLSPAKPKRTPSTVARRRSRQLFEPSPQSNSPDNADAVNKSPQRYQSIGDFDRQLARLLSQPGMIPPRFPSRAGGQSSSQPDPAGSEAEGTTAPEEILPVSRFVKSRTAISEEARQLIQKNIELYADPPNDPILREAYLKQRGISVAPSRGARQNKEPLSDAELGMSLYRPRQSIEEQDEEDSSNDSEQWRDFQPTVLRNRSLREQMKVMQASLKKKEELEIYRKHPSTEISAIYSELHIPATSLVSARVLTIRSDLVDSLVSYHQWFESHPTAKPPTAEQLGSVLENFSQSAEANLVLDSIPAQSPSDGAAPAAIEPAPQHPDRDDGDSGRAASDAKSNSNIFRPVRKHRNSRWAAFDDSHFVRSDKEDGEFGRAAIDDTNHSEAQQATAHPQTPETTSPASQVQDSYIWQGLSAVKNLVATPFRLFGGRRASTSDKTAITNGKPVPSNPFTLNLTKAGLVIPPKSFTPSPSRSRMAQSGRRRRPQTEKVLRHLPLGRKNIPVSARGIVSEERIAEIHAEQDRLAEERRKKRGDDSLLAGEEAEESQDHAAKHEGSAVAGEKRKRHPYGYGRTENGGFFAPQSPRSDSEEELGSESESEASTHTLNRNPYPMAGAWVNTPSPIVVRKERPSGSRVPRAAKRAPASPSPLEQRRVTASLSTDKQSAAPATAADGSFTHIWTMDDGEQHRYTWYPSHGINAKATLLCGVEVACYTTQGELLPESEHIKLSDVDHKMPMYKRLRALPADVQDYIREIRGKDLRFEKHELRLRNQYYDLEKKIYAGKIALHRDDIYRLLEDPNAPRYGAPTGQTESGGSKKRFGKRPVKQVLPGVYEVPSDSESSEDEEEQHQALEENAVLQERTWTQTPPPKPRPANAELPKVPPATPEVSRVQLDKYKPKTPSQLRHVTAMSPLQEEAAAVKGLKSCLKTSGVSRADRRAHFSPQLRDIPDDVIAAVLACPYPPELAALPTVNYSAAIFSRMWWDESDDEEMGEGGSAGPLTGEELAEVRAAWEDMSWEGTGVAEIR